MATAGSAEFDDYFKEFDEIESNKDEEEEEELSKTPDEGELEANWLRAVGYGYLVNKFQDGRDLSEDELETLTASLTLQQAEAVKRRVDTLTATFKRRQRGPGKMHMKDIFPAQDGSSDQVGGQNWGETSPPVTPPSPSGQGPQRKGSAKGRELRSFMHRGGYSMSGSPDEYAQEGVETLSIQPRAGEQWSEKVKATVSDDQVALDFFCEDKGDDRSDKGEDEDNHRVLNFELPAFEVVPDPLGTTRIGDLSSGDMEKISKLALIELTALFDQYNITYAKSKRKKKSKDSGIFGVPLTTLVEQDQKRNPNLSVKVPLVFQSMIQYLEKEALAVEGILRVPGNVSRVKQLRQEMEDKFYGGGFSWQDVAPHDAAALMKMFLRELPIPLLTHDHLEAFFQIEKFQSMIEKLKALTLLILALPEEHKSTLRLLLRFLMNVVAHSHENRMGLNNVAMIMAPNLFLAPAARSKAKSIKELELSKAAGTSNIVKMMLTYQEVLWTIPSAFVKQIRDQMEVDIQRKKTKLRFRGRKDKSDVYRKSQVIPEELSGDAVIRVQAPHLTKSSAMIQLDPSTTAADVVAKFRFMTKADQQGASEGEQPAGDGGSQNYKGGFSFRNPNNVHSAEKNAYLYEVGGNIGERCLDPKTRMLDLYHVNRNAEWLIKVNLDR